MKSAFLLLKNKELENFITNSKIFNISENKENCDFLFCDSIGDYNNLTNKPSCSKIYLSSYLMESINDLEVFSDFDYYIGFGKSFFENINKDFDIEISKSFEGFIFDEKYQNKFINKNFDIFIISSHDGRQMTGSNIFETRCIIDIIVLSIFLKKTLNIDVSIGSNAKKNNNLFDENNSIFNEKTLNTELKILKDDIELFYNNIDFIDFDFPMKYLNSSKQLHFLNAKDSRIYYDSTLNPKIVLPHIDSSMFYENEMKDSPIEFDYKYNWPNYHSPNIRSTFKSNKSIEFNLNRVIYSSNCNSNYLGTSNEYSRFSLNHNITNIINNLITQQKNITCADINDEFIDTVVKISNS